MAANNLVPIADEQLDVADSLLASLTDIAYATNPEEKKVVVKSERRSRFFFRLTPSFAEEVKSKQLVFTPKEIIHIDHEVEKRLKNYKLEMPHTLEQNIEEVREFFLREIAPVTLAAGAGASQALEVVRRLVGSDIDGTQFEKFERMAAKAVDIKMARFVARQFGLTKTEAAEILAALVPRTPTIIPVGVPQNERQVKEQPKKAPNV